MYVLTSEGLTQDRQRFKAITEMPQPEKPEVLRLVQSLNSPFFLPPIGAEPGRAKGESRITCMRMLRTNQSKITSSQHNYAARVNVSRNVFFSLRSKKRFSLTLILW